MKAQSLADNSVKIWEAVDEIIVRWIGSVFVHLITKTLLLLGVTSQFDYDPLGYKHRQGVPNRP